MFSRPRLLRCLIASPIRASSLQPVCPYVTRLVILSRFTNVFPWFITFRSATCLYSCIILAWTYLELTSSSFCIMKPSALAQTAASRTRGSVALSSPNNMLDLIVSLNNRGSYQTTAIFYLRYSIEKAFISVPSIDTWPRLTSQNL